MTPEEIQTWLKIAGLIGGMVVPAYGVWVLLQKRVTDLETRQEKRERVDESERLEIERQRESERAETERQRQAWWDELDAAKQRLSDLDKVCSNATTELRTTMRDLKERVDLHSGSNVANLAGLVRNYTEMLVQTLDTLRETLREARSGGRGA